MVEPAMLTAVRRHMPPLDAMRGVAVLLVLAHNFNLVVVTGRVSAGFDAVMNIGWVGVQLFFVLSGFLITGILLDTARANNYYRAFFARRTLRIFPLYYAVLAFGFVVLPLLAKVPAGHGRHQGWLWAYLTNWVEPFGRGEPAFPHFWSLAVEEQFYLLWPLVVHRMSARGVVRLSGALLVVVPVVRVLCRIAWGSEAAYTFTICRIDALAIGAMLAAALRDPVWSATLNRWIARIVAWVRLPRLLLLSAFAALFVVTRGLPRAGALSQSFGYSALAVVCVGWIVVEVFAWSQPNRAARPTPARNVLARGLRSVGKYSYAIYVFHAPLHLFVGLPLIVRLSHGQPPSLALAVGYAVVAMAATFLMAVVSFRVLEQPFLRLKDRFVATGSA
jgi:peptidoglycan/LPS O-acetylase OafA/YrhL